MPKSRAFVLLLTLAVLSACGAPAAPIQPVSQSLASQAPTWTQAPTETLPAQHCPDGFVQNGPSSCRDKRSPTPSQACPPGSSLVGKGCQDFTATPSPTPADTPTPSPTPDLTACRNLNLPAQYWLMPLDRVQSFLNTLDGQCIIFAYDPEQLRAAITFPGNVVVFEKAFQARLLLDQTPSAYAVVWGILTRPENGSSKYRVHVVQLRGLPKGQAPFSDGTYIVGAEDGPAPGPWKTAPHAGTSEDGCHWERETTKGRPYSSHAGTASTAATLYLGEGFKTENCTIWVHVGFSTTGEPITFVSAAQVNDPCNNRYDADGSCHSKDSTWGACLAAGECYEKYK